MNKMVEYGFLCSGKDEKMLINELTRFFEYMNRTISKVKNKSLLESKLPYVYKHYYWNLNKDKQVYIEVYPNQDVEGKCKFSNHDVGWVLFANVKDESEPYHVPFDEQEKYLQDLLSSTNLPYITLYEYKNGEERL
ncbi:hypothetical protein [Paenibacillus turpanensis]|uniref:hypothetical protein n=1 Tax=Paenibacillus turpanensis TaxID=2689078 RepID=UPI0014075D1C|nr:hypothetical protein [Paenibacillus turpanensis]